MKVAGGGAQLRRLELACTAVSEVAGASWVAAVSRLTGLGLRHTQVTGDWGWVPLACVIGVNAFRTVGFMVVIQLVMAESFPTEIR